MFNLYKFWQLCFGWFPGWFQICILCLLALFVIRLLFAIVKMVLDVIPFM